MATPEPGSARRLLELLEVGRASVARAEKSLAQWTPRIAAGTEQYKPPSDASRAKVEAAKSTGRGVPVAQLKQLVLKLSAAASLDEEQALHIAEAFLFENPVRDLASGESTLMDLLDFYLDERLALVSLPAALTRIAVDDSHHYKATSDAHLKALLDQGMEAKIIERCRVAAQRVLSVGTVANKNVASRLLAGALAEVCGHLEALFALYYARLAPSSTRLQQVLELGAEYEYGRRLTLALSASSAASGPAALLAARVAPLSCMLVLCALRLWFFAFPRADAMAQVC